MPAAPRHSCLQHSGLESTKLCNWSTLLHRVNETNRIQEMIALSQLLLHGRVDSIYYWRGRSCDDGGRGAGQWSVTPPRTLMCALSPHSPTVSIFILTCMRRSHNFHRGRKCLLGGRCGWVLVLGRWYVCNSVASFSSDSAQRHNSICTMLRTQYIRRHSHLFPPPPAIVVGIEG